VSSAWLLSVVERRLDLLDFFTEHVEGRGLLRGNFAEDVADKVQWRYSLNPMA
jgi:hypothetical protein